MPEKLSSDSIQSVALLEETLRNIDDIYTNTYQTIQITACGPEWLSHPSSAIGMRQQAEWYVRDCLHALAYGFHAIYPGNIIDLGSSYFRSPYGGGVGLLKRFPIMTPKPSYAAIATLTDVLDEMRYVTNLPTGSLSLYALEFVNKTNSQEQTYALWTVRGRRPVRAEFGQDTAFALVNLVGTRTETNTQGNAAEFWVGTGVKYISITNGTRLVNIVPQVHDRSGRKLAKEDFFLHDPVPPYTVIDSMTNADHWRVNDLLHTNYWSANGWHPYVTNWPSYRDGRPLLETPEGKRENRRCLPFRTIAPVESLKIAVANDIEFPGGATNCLELTFTSTNELSTPFAEEYAFLKLTNWTTLTNRPVALGMWVKGASQWGKVMWAFKDSDPRGGMHLQLWLSGATVKYGGDLADPTGRADVNYDGWNFLRVNLPSPSAGEREINPAWYFSGTSAIDGDITPVGLVVTMPRNVLYLDHMVPLTNRTIRLKDLCVIYD